MQGNQVIRLLQRNIARFGLQIGRIRPSLVSFLQSRKIEVVFDVGANVGQFGLQLRQGGYRGQIVSFEPVRALFDVLQTHARNDEGWEVHNLAVAATSGQSIIHVAELPVFSSLLSVRKAARALDSRAAPAREEEITAVTLDEYASKFASRRCFLKCDTQGYEREVMVGAVATLRTLLGVQMELPFVQLYSGGWTIAQAIEFMAQQGYAVAQMHPVGFHPADAQSWVEADCIFRRLNPSID